MIDLEDLKMLGGEEDKLKIIIMENQTKKITLKAGNKYSLCTCGTSKAIPFCDNSHRALNEKELSKSSCNFRSLKITPEKDVTIEVSSKTWESE